MEMRMLNFCWIRSAMKFFYESLTMKENGNGPRHDNVDTSPLDVMEARDVSRLVDFSHMHRCFFHLHVL